ncbi:MAG TPA: hypothetical protein ENI34_09240 [candidate division WOR-3 bacterium]|uniref:Uncharacterized protein n=1 Tax=candidate division WOR-3 bacterium TaxID=2052148 RepID=A0A9C9K0Q5_UNCW3|nr:hypothetical protein [candidate division WOR-3 bacterium]
MHLRNLARILKYTLKEISAERIIDILYEKTRFLIEQHITQRDIENFVAYLKFLSSSPRSQKVIKIDKKLMQDFVNHVYSECDHKTRYFRLRNLTGYFEKKLGKNVVLDKTELTVIFQKLKRDKQTSIDKVKMRVCIALILKWLQGFLEPELSEGLNQYVAFLASVYGLYGTNRVFNVDWQPYDVSSEDAAVINREYKFFESAITDAIMRVSKAVVKKPLSTKYKDQFQIVLESINKLIKLSEEGKLDSAEAFTNKIIIAATLIYLQDDFVEKDEDLNKFINLFVSFYYQFRDKRYIPVFIDGTSVYRSF